MRSFDVGGGVNRPPPVEPDAAMDPLPCWGTGSVGADRRTLGEHKCDTFSLHLTMAVAEQVERVGPAESANGFYLYRVQDT